MWVAACIALLTLHTTACAQQALLWRVTANNGAVSHVFGTIHLADTTVFRQPVDVLMALDTSSLFVAELDLDSVRAEGLNIRGMLAAPGSKLRDVLSDSDYVAVKKYVTTHLDGLMAMTMDNLKPGIVASMIIMGRMERTAPASVDEFLWNRAKTLRIPTMGVESAKEQLKALDAMPAEAIVDLVRNPEAFDSLHAVLRNAFARGDLDAIAGAVTELDQYESFATVINDDRNQAMVNRLQPRFQQGGVFLAVGAAHLAGPKGIVALLREQGFAVAPIAGTVRHSMLTAPLPTYTPGNTERTTR